MLLYEEDVLRLPSRASNQKCISLLTRRQIIPDYSRISLNGFGFYSKLLQCTFSKYSERWQKFHQYLTSRIGYKPLSYREVLERTGSERIETTIRKRQLGFAGALVRQGDSRLSKRVMFGRLAVQGPKRGGRPATSWVDCLQKNLEAFGAVPRKGKGRKWVAFGVVVKDGRDWMTAAKNMGKWHRGVERGAEALDSAWRRADLRQSNVQLQREVSEVVQ